MKLAYRDKGPRGPYAKTYKIIRRADEILSHYYRDGDGFPLTLRQLFYKLVTENLIANSPKEYDRLGQIMSDARYWGLIDWDMLIDRTRTMADFAYRRDEEHALTVAAKGYMNDPWPDQPVRVEVWVEKDAAIGTIEAVCNELRVAFGSTSGYHSTSGAKVGASRSFGIIASGQRLLALHLADHDPSGWDMTRDIRDRVEEFVVADLARQLWWEAEEECGTVERAHTWALQTVEEKLEIRRLALNLDQVDELGLLPQPLKSADTRSGSYIRQTKRTEGWELDALEPDYLADIIRRAVLDVRDESAWAQAMAAEEESRRILGLARDSWNGIRPLLNGVPAPWGGFEKLARIQGQGL
jgi:hypothetical protein